MTELEWIKANIPSIGNPLLMVCQPSEKKIYLADVLKMFREAIAGVTSNLDDRDRQVAVLREALEKWQHKFHETACYAGEFHHGVPIKPRRWCSLCEETNAALDLTAPKETL